MTGRCRAAARALGAPADQSDVPSPQHTAAFFAWVKQSLAAGLALEDTAPGWGPVLPWICRRAGLAPGRDRGFLQRPARGCRHARGAAAGAGGSAGSVPTTSGNWPRCSAGACRRAARASRLSSCPETWRSLAGFGTRGRLRHSHSFPVDLDRYTPLLSAQQALNARH